MIIEWMQCEVIEYDLWDVWFKTYQDGCIQQIKQKQ